MAESLRDQLSANLEKIVTVEAEPETPSTPSGDVGEPQPSKIAEAPERARDPKTGKFVEKDNAAAAPLKPVTATPPPADGKAVLAAAPKPKPARPSSWKKDYWPHWDKLTGGQQLSPEEASALAEYMGKRETDFQHGVATYKTEWENARPVMEALQPFLPVLKQHGIQPNVWVANLGAAHRELALGSPQAKLQRFAELAKQYGVPLEAFSDQEAQQRFLAGNGGGYQTPQPQALTREEADRLFQERFNAMRGQEDIQNFAKDTEKHPHFEAVRETMAQLLEAQLAEDLPSAYEAALRHPRHSDLWEAIQEQKRAQEAEANAKAEADRLLKAKGKAVSVRSATPSAPAGDKPKDRRSLLEENLDAIAGGARL